jgi:hypothetical protein
MDTEPIASQEQKPSDNFDFEKYRDICDAHTEGARKLGLLDKELAERSLADPRTIALEVEGQLFPILVPIEYAAGYDPERTKKIVADNGGEPRETYYYALPPGLADETMQAALLEQIQSQKLQDMFVYFDYDSRQASAKAEFEALISGLSKEVSSIPLHDPEVAEHNKQAALGLYVTSTRRTEASEHEPVDGLSIYDEYKKAVEAGEFELIPENGATLLKGSDISPELRDKMWEIYIDRFQNLGEFHPIVMEDSREGFEELINQPDTTVGICFSEGEPACWACFITDIEHCFWLDPKFFSQANLDMGEDETMLFFPEIVAKVDKIGGYSKPIIQLLAQMAAKSGVNYRVTFESTNRSVEYIPSLVKQYIDETGVLSADEATEVDKALYACYKIANI